MAERYTILQHNTNTFHVVDCPILLVSHALTKDNQNNNIFIQCKFENTLSKPIKALYVHINCFDVTNNPLPDVDSFSYLDIQIEQYQTFGDRTPIVLPDKETRNVSIIPTKIVFVDGSTWENKSFKPFELFHIDNTPISELGKLAEEYRRELHGICLQSGKHKYLPANKDGYTICGCGKILVDAEKTCPACGVNLEKLFALHDVDKLQAGLEQYNSEQFSHLHENIDSTNSEGGDAVEDSITIGSDNTENVPSIVDASKQGKKKKIIIGGIAAIIALVIACLGFFMTQPRPLEQTTTLSDGSTLTLQGGYLMEVPCYSYGVYERDFETDDNEFLCLAFNIANNGTENLVVKNLLSGEVKDGNSIVNDEVIYMDESEDEEEISIPSYSDEDVLLAFPIPKGSELRNLTTAVKISDKIYIYQNEFKDVREFVRGMHEQMLVGVQIRSDITTALGNGAQLAQQVQDSNGLLTYVYAKQFVDGLYESLDDMQSRNRSLINAINELTPPDIPFYKEMQQAMIDDANTTITKLESINDVEYPTNINNLNSNVDIMVALYDKFPSLGMEDMLTMGQHWIVDFKD